MGTPKIVTDLQTHLNLGRFIQEETNEISAGLVRVAAALMKEIIRQQATSSYQEIEKGRLLSCHKESKAKRRIDSDIFSICSQ
ncbi:hypothetical protein MFLAVUS_010665 [Mucor flavus]|uniref:Uncharacterized protein n=1 Tax=Mucor flavus TaxID=439312 RepID=A0ABP9ZDC9_9FUNG